MSYTKKLYKKIQFQINFRLNRINICTTLGHNIPTMLLQYAVICPTMNFLVLLMIFLVSLDIKKSRVFVFNHPLNFKQSACTGQSIDETTTTVPHAGTDLITITLPQSLETTTSGFETTTGFPDDEMPTFPSLLGTNEEEDDENRMVPFGVVLDEEQVVVKKRCRCIQKKQRKVVKEIKYIPLNPSIQLAQLGRNRNFTCKCSHLRKLARKP